MVLGPISTTVNDIEIANNMSKPIMTASCLKVEVPPTTETSCILNVDITAV
jgi:hypothetical protein